MKYNIIIRPEAQLDISEAVKWYEERLKGLGSIFLMSVDATIESILRTPEAYTPIYKKTRRALVRKFPFGVHDIINEKTIVVLAVFHASRNPKEWKKRIL